MGSRFTIRAENPAYARQIVRSTLRGANSNAVETAALLTSELVTNSMVHAKSDPQIFLDTREGHVYVEVRDSGANPAIHLSEIETSEPHGWRLDMINALASSWGIKPLGDGRVIWFDLAF
jgi:anti-sigma regulatory factor (Ser/Thr protein kinase)